MSTNGTAAYQPSFLSIYQALRHYLYQNNQILIMIMSSNIVKWLNCDKAVMEYTKTYYLTQTICFTYSFEYL